MEVSAQVCLSALTTQFIKVCTSQKDSAAYFLNVLEKLRNKDNQSQVLNCRAIFVERWEGNYPKALKIIDTAIVTAKDSGDYYVALNSKANFLQGSGKYSEAIKINMLYLGYAKRKGRQELIGKIYNNIGSTYSYANQDMEGIYYLKKSLEYFNASKARSEYYRTSMILGASYIKVDSLQKAKRYLYEAIKYFKNTPQSLFYADAMKEYSVVLHSEQRYDSAIYYMREAYEIFQNQNSMESLALISLNLSACYQDSKNIKLAGQYVNLGYKYALENNKPDILMMASYSNYEFYKDQKRIDKALSFYELYVAYNDTLTNEQKQSELNSLNIKFKTAEKDNQILKDKADLSERDLLIQKQKTNIYVVSIILLFSVITLVIVFYFIRKQRKLNNDLTELNTFKNKVISIISHDLRSPIAEIAGGSREENIKGKAASALDILESLLGWSYPQLNKSQLRPTKIILSEILEDTREQVLYLTNGKSQNIVQHIDESLTFMGDYDTTLIIFRNLLTNASKYSDDFANIHIIQEDNMISIINNFPENIKAGTGIGIKLCEDLAKQNNYTLTIDIGSGKATASLQV